MSIIADTLKRLQAQADDSPAKPKEDVVQRPTFNKGEGSGRHRKDSPFAFLMVTVGMTITLGGFAVAAFWIGGFLDFGLGSTTQARLNDQRSFPRALDISEEPIFDSQSTETQVTAALEPTPAPETASTLGKNAQKHESENFAAKTSFPQSTPQEETTPFLENVEIHDASSTNATDSIASPDESLLSPPREQLSNEQEESLASSSSKSDELSSSVTSNELPSELVEDPDSGIIVSDQEDGGKSPEVIAMLSEEEIIQAEEFLSPSDPSNDSPPRRITLAALKAQQEPLDHEVQRTVPLQPSPASRLSHAQKLIRAGEYEDAVALLDPLFNVPPVKWQPWFWMGTALLGKGDMEKADQFFLSGLARNDKIPHLWIQRALVAQQRGDYQLAVHELRQAESIAADIPHVYLNLGYAYEQLGNDRLANQYYGKFLSLSEDQPAFFATRKKLFARLTQQTPIVKAVPPSSLLP